MAQVTTNLVFDIVAVRALCRAASSASGEGQPMRVGGTHTKRVDEVLSRIPLSPPWTVHEFLAWLEKDTGRPILLKPYPEGTAIGNRRCGVLYGLDNKDIIMFDPNRSERLQRQ